MAKGGARARSGPPPDPSALRRDRPSDGDWTTLPAEGRRDAKGRKRPPPAWPLRKATELVADDELLELARETEKREAAVWKSEWERPQAVMWEQLGLDVEVALYVRALVGAEHPAAPVNLRTLVKQFLEELGISTAGLARNRWRIATVADTNAAPARRAPAGRSARQRFTVVNGGRDGE